MIEIAIVLLVLILISLLVVIFELYVLVAMISRGPSGDAVAMRQDQNALFLSDILNELRANRVQADGSETEPREWREPPAYDENDYDYDKIQPNVMGPDLLDQHPGRGGLRVKNRSNRAGYPDGRNAPR